MDEFIGSWMDFFDTKSELILFMILEDIMSEVDGRGVKAGGSGAPKRRRNLNRGRWTTDEDSKLKSLIQTYGEDNFAKVATFFPDRSEMQCATRWSKVLSPSIVKGQWTKEEDDKVVELVNKFGAKKWTLIARHLEGRIGKQCRER